MLGSPILYLKAMRILMFQLSGFYCMKRLLSSYGALGLLTMSGSVFRFFRSREP